MRAGVLITAAHLLPPMRVELNQRAVAVDQNELFGRRRKTDPGERVNQASLVGRSIRNRALDALTRILLPVAHVIHLRSPGSYDFQIAGAFAVTAQSGCRSISMKGGSDWLYSSHGERNSVCDSRCSCLFSRPKALC